MPNDYNDVLFFKEKFSPASWDQFMAIPYIVWLKIKEYSNAQAKGQELRSKKKT